MIALVVAVAALTAAAISFLQTPVYRVEIVMAATAPKNPTTKLSDPTISLAYQASMPSIASACESIDIARATRERLLKSNVDIPAEELLGMVSANPVANSNSLKILVSDRSPYRVTEIANAWGAEASATLSHDALLFGGELKLINPAVPPSKPAKPKPSLYVGLGVFSGLVLGLCFALGLEYLDPRFHTSSKIEEELKVPLLATIPDGKETDSAEDAYAHLRATLVFSDAGRQSSIAMVPPSHQRAARPARRRCCLQRAWPRPGARPSSSTPTSKRVRYPG